MADYDLTGKKIAFLLTDGVEQPELTEPWKAAQDAGAQTVLVSPSENDRIQAFKGDVNEADTFQVDVPVATADPNDYDALVLPGGVVNSDTLRTDQDSVQFVRSFFDAGKPVAAICHAPWILIEAGVVDNRTLTSYPSLQTDLKNAGAEWVDEEVVVDQGLVTSRTPEDLPAFNDKMLEEISEGEHEGQIPANN